jgi:oligopeptide/dipeptide ABC transporter ATP-binding protein
MTNPDQIANAASTPSESLLEVRDLHTEFRSDTGAVRAVDGISFHVARGEVLGIVGESGCGKSATSLSILRVLPRNGRIVSGSVRLAGSDLVSMPEPEMRQVRGRRIAMIFQDPMTCLNPYLKVSEQLAETGMLHLGLTRKAAEARALALLRRVHIPDAAARLQSYPHELSGGMRQRVMIAMALLCDPELLIADEPTTALDVTIQAQILELLRELQRERKLSIILITHDLGVVSQTCDRVLVMYAGRVVETAPARTLFRAPSHPYTAALLRSIPRIDAGHGTPLQTIPGMPPRLDQGPFQQCTFAPRCRFVHDACRRGDPHLVESEPGHARRCVLPKEQVA